MIKKVKKTYRKIRSLYGQAVAGFPSKNMVLIGVTGTSGKSTTSSMIYHILKENNFNVGLISTIEAIAGDKKIDTGFHVTTPDPIQLQRILKEMKNSGVTHCIVETSSHALDQGRLGFLKFDYAVYTNIKRDHLDYHKTWEEYVRAKASLIDMLKPNSVVVLNKDDKEAYLKLKTHLVKKSGVNIKDYSLNALKSYSEASDQINFRMEEKGQRVGFVIPILGIYNIENALAAIRVAESMGITLKNCAKSFTTFKTISGRMEVMQSEPFMVIVDFAHNTDSLVKSLESAKKSATGKLITLFGSAGLRDKEKRTTMGKASGAISDITIITAEDPRTEKLYDINSKIIEGAEDSGAKLVKRFKNHEEYIKFQILDLRFVKDKKYIFAFDEESVASRFDAIDFAIKIATPGDVVITEGKGHEKSLCFGTTEYPFRDQEAVEKALGR